MAMTPVREASRIPNGLHNFINDDTRPGLAHNSMTIESDDTSTTLASNKRDNSVKARKCENVSRKVPEDC